jgi:hypothetical protein
MFVKLGRPFSAFHNLSASQKKLRPRENAFPGFERTSGLSEYAYLD